MAVMYWSLVVMEDRTMCLLLLNRLVCDYSYQGGGATFTIGGADLDSQLAVASQPVEAEDNMHALTEHCPGGLDAARAISIMILL